MKVTDNSNHPITINEQLIVIWVPQQNPSLSTHIHVLETAVKWEWIAKLLNQAWHDPYLVHARSCNSHQFTCININSLSIKPDRRTSSNRQTKRHFWITYIKKFEIRNVNCQQHPIHTPYKPACSKKQGKWKPSNKIHLSRH
jgi:hypothetical protein